MSYFARVAPLLGEGLRAFSVATDNVLLAELLAASRLGRIIGPASLQAHLTWKNAHEPTQVVPVGVPDVVVACVPADTPYSHWADRLVTVGLPADAFAQREVINDVARSITESLMGKPWRQGRIGYGSVSWPFGPNRGDSHCQRDGHMLDHLMVIGLGSVGSEALRTIRAKKYTLVDAAKVSDFNPVRQWFGSQDVGKSKAEVLAARLGGTAVVEHITTQAEADALIARHQPDAALLATGTHQHGLLSRALRDIPHVAACAYPQARFFEVIVCTKDTPKWHDYRGDRAQHFPPVVQDEVANFLYQLPDSRERDTLCKDLVAEPAPASATARIADVAARCLASLDAEWMQRLIRARTTCLLGANVTEGIHHAGHVMRLGPDDVTF